TASRYLLAFLLAVVAAPAPAQDGEDATTLSRRLAQMFVDYAIASRTVYPMFATVNGFRDYDGQFTNDISEEHREDQRRFCRGGLAKLQGFDRARLSGADQLSYDVFRVNQLRCLERLEFDTHLTPIDQGGWTLPATFPIWGAGEGPQPFRNAGDYDK